MARVFRFIGFIYRAYRVLGFNQFARSPVLGVVSRSKGHLDTFSLWGGRVSGFEGLGL